MILNYHDKSTEAFANRRDVPAFRAFAEQLKKRLLILDAATSLADLRALPSNRLEMLHGKRKGQWSIRVNSKWRLCFIWNQGDTGPSDVEAVDYHDE